MYGGIVDCDKFSCDKSGRSWCSDRKRAEMLLNILQDTGQPPRWQRTVQPNMFIAPRLRTGWMAKTIDRRFICSSRRLEES